MLIAFSMQHTLYVFLPGEDPLTDSECDIDSVAGVLKLYFRDLEKPLFPEESFSQLMECVRKITVMHFCVCSLMNRCCDVLLCYCGNFIP